VTSDGVALAFKIRSDFGAFDAPSQEMAELRIAEVAAIARLEELKSSDIFADALAASVKKKAETVAQVIEDPEGTARGVGKGLKRVFGKAKKAAQDVSEAARNAEAGQIGLLASLRPERDGGPVSVTVEFWRDGGILAESSPEVPDPDAAGQILLARSFALPSIEPGRYQVYVRMRQRDKEASAGTSFRLERADPFGLLPGS
jgi:hypothetical protein